MRSLDEVLAETPILSSCGWGVGKGMSWERPRDDVVQAVAESIEGMAKTKTATRWKYNSYVLKHIAEQKIGRYVTNGEFIAAALMQGFRVKPYPGSINVGINMAVRDVRRYNREAGNVYNL